MFRVTSTHRAQMSEAAEARDAAGAAQRSAQDMLDSRQALAEENVALEERMLCLLYTSPSPRD